MILKLIVSIFLINTYSSGYLINFSLLKYSLLLWLILKLCLQARFCHHFSDNTFLSLIKALFLDPTALFLSADVPIFSSTHLVLWVNILFIDSSLFYSITVSMLIGAIIPFSVFSFLSSVHSMDIIDVIKIIKHLFYKHDQHTLIHMFSNWWLLCLKFPGNIIENL